MRRIKDDENITKQQLKNLRIFISIFVGLLVVFILYFTIRYSIYDFLVIMGLAFFGTIPAFLANAFMPLIGSIKKIKSYPVDGGKSWNGKRIFGPGKTWNGLISGILLGFIASYLLSIWIYPDLYYLTNLNFGDGATVLEYITKEDILFFVDITSNPTAFHLRTFLLCLGSPLGDLVGSFIKRRLDRPRGSQLFVLDQIDFIVLSVLFAYPVFPLKAEYLIFLVIFTPLLTVFANTLSYYGGAKEVPW